MNTKIETEHSLFADCLVLFFAVQLEYLKIRVKLKKCKRTAYKLRSLDVVFGVLPRPSMVQRTLHEMIICDGVA